MAWTSGRRRERATCGGGARVATAAAAATAPAAGAVVVPLAAWRRPGARPAPGGGWGRGAVGAGG